MNQGPVQLPLTLNIVEVLEPGERVEGPTNIVYSTSPRIAASSDGSDYILKGPEVEIVVAEATAYLLASLVGIPVPEFGVTTIDGLPFFASRRVRLRNVSAFIERGLLTNPGVLQETVVFDIWIANVDRNVGNFVGETADEPPPKVKLYPIDFEKAACLRERTPLVVVPTIDQRKFWPKDSLGGLLTGKPLPSAFCDRIASVSRENIRQSLELVQPHVNDIPWRDSCIQVLWNRGRMIHRLAGEVWR